MQFRSKSISLIRFFVFIFQILLLARILSWIGARLERKIKQRRSFPGTDVASAKAPIPSSSFPNAVSREAAVIADSCNAPASERECIDAPASMLPDMPLVPNAEICPDVQMPANRRLVPDAQSEPPAASFEQFEDDPVLENQTGNPKTLAGWERRLRILLAGKAFLGEIDLTPSETTILGSLINGMVATLSFSMATEVLIKDYPYAFSCYLIFHGRYHYENSARAFWPSVCRQVGIPCNGSYTAAWGQAFAAIMKQLQMDRPLDIEGYVEAILLHGGIPRSCLPGFFEYLLDPVAHEPKWAGLGPRALIQQWLGSPALALVPQPVQRFLQFGDEMAVRIVKGCLRMASESHLDDLDSFDYILPTYIAEEYLKWLNNYSNILKNREELTERKTAPYVMLALWDREARVVLPKQRIRVLGRRPQLKWQIRGGDISCCEKPIRMRIVGDMAETEEIEFTVSFGNKYNISLYDGKRNRGSWDLSLIPSGGGVCFSPRTGKQIPAGKTLPDEMVWVVVQEGTEIATLPASEHFVREYLPEVQHGWRGLGLNLHSCAQLRITDTENVCHYIPIVRQESSHVHLLGDVFPDEMEHHRPLFIGYFPRLIIPDPGNDYPASLSRYKIRLIAKNDDHIEILYSLDQLKPFVVKEESSLSIDLGIKQLLGEFPSGDFVVRVFREGEVSQRLDFRVLDYLSIEEDDRPCLSEIGEASCAMTWDVVTSTGKGIRLDRLSAVGSSITKESRPTTEHFHITLPSSQAHLAFSVGQLDGSGWVPIQVSSNRPRWLLQLDAFPGNHWRSSGLTQHLLLEELEQCRYPRLWLHIPSSTSNSYLKFTLTDSLGKATQVEQVESGSSFFSFDLRQIRDTLRDGANPPFRLRVDFINVPELAEYGFIPLQVERGLKISNLNSEIEYNYIDNNIRILFNWDPAFRLDNQQFCLWPKARPWEPPIQIPVEKNSQYCLFEGHQDTFPLGEYYAKLMIHDCWDDLGPDDRGQFGNETIISIGNNLDRLARLQRLAPSFEHVGERLLLSSSLGNADPGLERWVCEHCVEAPIPVAIALIRALGDAACANSMRLALYSASNLRKIWASYKRQEIEPRLWRSYLALCPPMADLEDDSVEELIQIPEPSIRDRAISSLVDRGVPSAIDFALDSLSTETMGDDDVLELFSRNPLFSAQILLSRFGDPRVLHLLRGLADICPESIQLVEVGYWVHCAAGWGKITDIVARGKSLKRTTIDSLDDCRLSVHLRPGCADEEVISIYPGLGRYGKIEFEPGTTPHFVCLKCDGFVTRYPDNLGQHNRISHGGVNRQERILEELFLFENKQIRFKIKSPINKEIWT